MILRKTEFLIMCLFAFMACEKEKESTTLQEAILHGQDAALCGCCGNWLIQIEDRIDNNRQFLELPADSDIDLEDETFPMNVKARWKEDPNSHCGFLIIEEIERN